MRKLDCKRCTKSYEGDQAAARICNPCYKVLEKANWGDEEIMERYAPSDDEIEPDDEEPDITDTVVEKLLAPPCHIAEKLRSR